MMRCPFSRSGSVLIIVLWICVGLTAIALTFAHTSLMAYRGSDNELAGQQAEWATEGGARYAMELLANPTTPGVLPEIDTYEAEAVPVGEATFWFLGGSPDDNAAAASGRISNANTPVFALIDEASKINVNMPKAQLLQLLANLPNITEEVADAIVDWVDTDEDVTNSGAESSTYSALSPAYSSKNAPFESLEELALLNGATFEILYGEDANLNGVLDPNEDDGDESAPVDNTDGKLDPGILQYLTCYSRLTSRANDGSTRVDVTKVTNVPNAATLNDLTSLLNELGADVANTIQQNLTAAASKPPAPGAPAAAATFNSVMQFYIQSQMSEDQLAKIIDRIWIAPTGSKQYVDGLININTASQTVLACIPGILDKAGDVVSARDARSTKDTNIAWLRGVIGDANALVAGPFITGETSQVTADVAAVGRHGRGYRRTRFVIDTTTGTPRIVYRRNLSSLGWALGSDVRASLTTRKEETK